MHYEPMQNQSLIERRAPAIQLDLFGDPVFEDEPGYLTEQLITYIGNKRSLISDIDVAVSKVRERLGKDRLRVLDAFSGSGVVARYFKRHSEYLATIDIEDYAAVVARCFLKNRSDVDFTSISDLVEELNNRVETDEFSMGFIEEMYAPRSMDNITKDDRAFYTPANARRLDNYRRMLNDVPTYQRDLLLGPLLSGASVHANTSGVFKGFHKDRNTKVGCFGGTNGDALKRIFGKIQLDVPILSRFDCSVEVFQGDTNKVAPTIRDLDLVYLDPPYNQHPYGSNYFMLNLIVNYERPHKVSRVSGIPVNWKRSEYNVCARACDSFRSLLESLQTRFLLISFNNEGFIAHKEMIHILERIGSLEVFNIKYNTFRGCRNIRNRPTHVVEHLFLVEKF